MIRKLKTIRIATIAFLLVIAIVTYFIIEEQNIVDILYLVVVLFYFVRYLLLQRKYKRII